MSLPSIVFVTLLSCCLLIGAEEVKVEKEVMHDHHPGKAGLIKSLDDTAKNILDNAIKSGDKILGGGRKDILGKFVNTIAKAGEGVVNGAAQIISGADDALGEVGSAANKAVLLIVGQDPTDSTKIITRKQVVDVSPQIIEALREPKLL